MELYREIGTLDLELVALHQEWEKEIDRQETLKEKRKSSFINTEDEFWTEQNDRFSN
jgi:hypothetical protein